MTVRLAAVALAVLAAVPAPSNAVTHAGQTHMHVDGAYVVGWDAKAKAGAVATFLGYTTSGTRVTAAGPADVTAEYLAICLSYGTATATESGCVRYPAFRPITTGSFRPESATIRVRVPVERRRGGWIEADLVVTTTGVPVPHRPAGYGLYRRDVLGIELYTDVNVTAGAVRHDHATIRGTLRTDRGLTIRPADAGSWFPTSLLRADYLTADGRVDPRDVSAALRATAEQAAESATARARRP